MLSVFNFLLPLVCEEIYGYMWVDLLGIYQNTWACIHTGLSIDLLKLVFSSGSPKNDSLNF